MVVIGDRGNGFFDDTDLNKIITNIIKNEVQIIVVK
jgi:hypothetical protein